MKPNNKTPISLDDCQKQRRKIGKRLRELRKLKGHTSADLFAYSIGIERAQYGRYERGETNFVIDSLLNILAGLDVSLSEFFSEGFD